MCIVHKRLLFHYYLASSFWTRPDEIDREYSVSNKKIRVYHHPLLYFLLTIFLIFHITTLIFLLSKWSSLVSLSSTIQFEILFQLIIRRYDSQWFGYRRKYSSSLSFTSDGRSSRKTWANKSRRYAPSLHIIRKSIRRSYRIRSYCIYHILEKPKSRKRNEPMNVRNSTQLEQHLEMRWVAHTIL